jgi:hypothetical protein
VRLRRYWLGAVLCGLAACSSAPASPPPAPTSSGAADEHVDVCQKLPADLLSLDLGVDYSAGVPTEPQAALLGACDYARRGSVGYKHVYVGVRSNSQYDTFVSRYSNVHVTTHGRAAAFGPTVGLLIKMPFTDYFLQIAVQGEDGTRLLTPAETIAGFFLGQP